MANSTEYMRQWREANPAYTRKYNQQFRHERIRRAHQLLGGECCECGAMEDLDNPTLEIDHINPKDKLFEVATRISASEEKFLAELDKCQLLCHDCHMKKTISERGQKAAKGTHGTLSAYRYCKCKLCKEAYSEYQKEYRRKNKKSKKKEVL